MTLLDVCLALPAAGSLLVAVSPGARRGLIRWLALAVSVVVLLVSIVLALCFERGSAQFQFATDVVWIPSPAIRYHVGVDGLSLWLVLLVTLLTPVAVLVSWRHIGTRVKEFHALLLVMECGLIGVFVSLDLFLFYVFWEVSLVPMYFLIGIWGHERRVYAAVKFFLFTMAGSVFMLAAILYLYSVSDTFDYGVLMRLLESRRLVLDPGEQTLLFLGFMAAFAVKAPLFPLHSWLPDAHGEAPAAASVLLASVMLKMGVYGMMRFCLPLFPQASRDHASWVTALAIAGVVYGALVAMAQPNLKRLVAYSSVSHLGFAVLGVFSFTQMGLDGAVLVMLSHGLSTGALFVLAGLLYERRHSLAISDFGGVASCAPGLAAVFQIAALASLSLPLLCNFAGEYLVLQGAAMVDFRRAAFAALGIILSACYLLWLFQRVFLGETPAPVAACMRDLRPREWAALLPLVALMVWLGVAPVVFLRPVSRVTESILWRSERGIVFQVRNAGPVFFEEAVRAR